MLGFLIHWNDTRVYFSSCFFILLIYWFVLIYFKGYKNGFYLNYSHSLGKHKRKEIVLKCI